MRFRRRSLAKRVREPLIISRVDAQLVTTRTVAQLATSFGAAGTGGSLTLFDPAVATFAGGSPDYRVTLRALRMPSTLTVTTNVTATAPITISVFELVMFGSPADQLFLITQNGAANLAFTDIMGIRVSKHYAKTGESIFTQITGTDWLWSDMRLKTQRRVDKAQIVFYIPFMFLSGGATTALSTYFCIYDAVFSAMWQRTMKAR